ncbi:MAG: type II secretion system protein GspG [Cellvibrionales bacterium TMED49]|nr:type II secretion system protein GspG [Porticoccaceae bacterium]OUU40092.1 MAG: type II secretion system protein GspG [Cellvibrionales bacterium TMED49]|tara:strand:- start:521 stop:976 length:456 start_codon:yes stop_codon:yes gene_type:complete
MREKTRSIKRTQEGFTLIEMMVVVVVIGLLAAMIGPRLFNQVEKAQRVRIKQDIRAIESALKFYRLDNYSYPAQSDGLEALLTAPGGASGSRWNGPYLEEVPMDPFQQPYEYSNPGTRGKEIEIFTLGKSQTPGGEGVEKDWGSWNINEIP